jgi:hypothetical protein
VFLRGYECNIYEKAEGGDERADRSISNQKLGERKSNVVMRQRPFRVPLC